VQSEARERSISRRSSSQKDWAILKAGEFAALGLVILSATCALIAAVLFLRISNLWKCSLLVGLAVIELFSAGRVAHQAFRLDEAYPGMWWRCSHRGPAITGSEPGQPQSGHVHGMADVWGYDPLIPPSLWRVHGLDAAGGHGADRKK